VVVRILIMVNKGFILDLYPEEITTKMKKKFPDFLKDCSRERMGGAKSEKVDKMKYTIDKILGKKK
jgi:hypothetical protein